MVPGRQTGYCVFSSSPPAPKRKIHAHDVALCDSSRCLLLFPELPEPHKGESLLCAARGVRYSALRPLNQSFSWGSETAGFGLPEPKSAWQGIQATKGLHSSDVGRSWKAGWVLPSNKSPVFKKQTRGQEVEELRSWRNRLIGDVAVREPDLPPPGKKRIPGN